jgi:arginine:ornithine antiporter/lysine permease
MTAMVVGSMVAAGAFSLPRRFAQEAGILGAMIAWLIAGSGTLMVARRRPAGPDARTGDRRARDHLHGVPADRGGTEVHARLVHHLRPASVLFVMARREQGRQLFSRAELLILGISIAGAVIGPVALFAGWITI